MAWIGTEQEVMDLLRRVEADRGADGRFIISGEPPISGLGDELVIPDGATYFRHGRPFYLARSLRDAGVGFYGFKVFEAGAGYEANPIPQGSRKQVRERTKRFDREINKRLANKEAWRLSIRDAMPKYSAVVYVEDCPGSGDFDRAMDDVLDAFRASGLDKQLYFDGTDYGPLPGPKATKQDIAQMGCPERGYHFYDAGSDHPAGVDIGSPGYRAAAIWERDAIESSLVSRAAERSNPEDRRGVASGRLFKLRGVAYQLPPAIAVQWSPANQAWLVLWNDQVLRVIGDTDELRDYLRQLGARTLNPDPAQHKAAYQDYLHNAEAHINAAIPLLQQRRYAEAFGPILHAECDIRQAYTEAVYGKSSKKDLAQMVVPLGQLYSRLRTQISLIQEQL